MNEVKRVTWTNISALIPLRFQNGLPLNERIIGEVFPAKKKTGYNTLGMSSFEKRDKSVKSCLVNENIPERISVHYFQDEIVPPSYK